MKGWVERVRRKIGDKMKEAECTLSGLRLARSIATAPPIDWPYRILKVGKGNERKRTTSLTEYLLLVFV